MPKPTADHMIPLCQHGDHTLSNIVPCCLRCNVRKQGRNLAQLLLAGGIK
jgi:5-methylcytosine-specific restriction endonuclease McrA